MVIDHIRTMVALGSVSETVYGELQGLQALVGGGGGH